MKPIKFKEANVIYGKNQKEYEPLPALKFEDGTMVTCWRLSWRELLSIVWKRKVWVSVLTFNKPLQPLYITTKQEEVFTTNK